MRRRKSSHLLSRELRLSKAGYRLIAGVDEAGRGPLAGPVVASAVILKERVFESIIDDSKKLSKGQREKAFAEILKKAFVGIGIVDEKVIDEINILKATKRAMESALSNLNIPPDIIIVDGRVNIDSPCPVKCIIKGDAKFISIAAASIIAKVTRDRIMRDYDAQFPQYGFARHKGYPTRSHKSALRAHGPSPIHRKSFKPVKCIELY